MRKAIAAAGIVLASASSIWAQDARVTTWLINTTSKTGHSTDNIINGYVSQTQSDVQQVYYIPTSVYVKTTDVPSHDVGPFPTNPAYPANQNNTWRIPRTVTVPATHTATPMGPIGVMLNGAQFFNARDAVTYANTWHQNAVYVEGLSFDSALGHPAPQMGATPDANGKVPGAYHYHEHPEGLQGQLDDDGDHHSPLLGYAFDGVPIYGGYGYSDSNNVNSPIERLDSSYRLRNIADRHRLAGQTTDLPSNQWGPAIDSTHPLGYYVEDFEYVPGLGDLDEYNGRSTMTPDFGLTYAYFATIDGAGAGAYPYLVGPTYYGTVAADDLSRSVTIPANATLYVAPEPGAAAICGIFLAGGLLRRGRPRR